MVRSSISLRVAFRIGRRLATRCLSGNNPETRGATGGTRGLRTGRRAVVQAATNGRSGQADTSTVDGMSPDLPVPSAKRCRPEAGRSGPIQDTGPRAVTLGESGT